MFNLCMEGEEVRVGNGEEKRGKEMRRREEGVSLYYCGSRSDYVSHLGIHYIESKGHTKQGVRNRVIIKVVVKWRKGLEYYLIHGPD